MADKKPSRLSFSYPDEIQKPLKKEADKKMRSLPNLIKMILDNHLKKNNIKEEK